MQAAAAAGVPVPGLFGPPCPVQLDYLLGWFLDLAGARGANGFGGMNPLTFSELDAWARLNDVRPTPYEVRLLRALDAAFLKSLRPEPKAKK